MRHLTNDRRRRRRAVVLAGALLAPLLPLAALSASAASGGYTASQVAAVNGTVVAVDSATNTIYLGTSTGVTVIDGATHAVTAAVSLPGAVQSVAVDSATDTVYVTENFDNQGAVEVIDGATNAVTTAITEPTGEVVRGVAVDDATDTVYVAALQPAGITIIDGATNTISGTVTTATGTAPLTVAVDASSDVVWVADSGGSVIGIDGATDTITNTIRLASGEPVSVAVNAASDTVYVTDLRNDDVAVIDGATGALSTLVPVGADIYGIAVNQTSDVTYASSYGPNLGTTWVIDGGTDQVTDSIARGSTGLTFNQATGTAYESSTRGDGVWALTASATNAMSPVITGASPPEFVTGVASTFTFTTSALPTATTYTETGDLPQGLTMTTSGVLSGTPAAGAGGLYPIAVTASNGVAPDYTKQLNLFVGQPPVFTSGSRTTFQVGTAGIFPLQATSYPAPTFGTANVLPNGVSISAQASGEWQLSGTPTAGTGGVYPITIQAYNDVFPTADQDFTLTVQEAPSFITSAQPIFTAATHGSYQIPANGYPAPTYGETGALPSGVSLSPAGLLAGTPSAHSGGVYKFTVSASNGIGSAASGSFTLTVRQAPSFSSANHSTFRAGSRHTFTFRTTGFPVPKLTEHGRLPRGVKFRARSNGTAVLTGTAPHADKGKTYVIVVTATNSARATVIVFHLKIS